MVAAFEVLPEPPQKIHLSVRALVLLRLELAQANKDAVRRALSFLALPAHAVPQSRPHRNLMLRRAGVCVRPGDR